MNISARRLALASLLLSATSAAHADNTAQTLPFSQDWTSPGLITVADDWSGVPGIVGYRGDNVTASTGVDPQTLLGEGTPTVDVVAQAATNNTSGGVLEIESEGTIAMQGSGTADAPSLVISLDTTGQSTITVSYVLRDLDASADDAAQAFALQYRIGNTGDFVNVPAGHVADATTAGAATLVTPVSAQLPAAADNQALVQVRIITSNATGNDELVGIDDISITSGTSGPVVPKLTISDTGAAEGGGGTTTLLFTASLSAPAGAGGVSFDYMTHDLTATTADGDYIGVSGTAAIAEGQTSVTLGVEVSGDTIDEGNETFAFDATNLVGATALKSSGIGTIYNDDMPLTPIHDVQGNGAMSPIVGSTVTVRGVVTGRKSNGFFVQAADADADADPMTSEGVFVFTNSTPPAAAAVGNVVLVTAAIAEYTPAADLLQLPLTELVSPAVLQLSTGNPLPSPVALTTSLPSPTGGLDQLERYEGMRVTAASFTVAAPTQGSTDEPSATGSSNGLLHVVVTGNARPMREPGIQVPDPDPAGTTATAIPRWDFNPELLTVDSDALGGAQINVAAGTTLANLVGPLDYGFRRYTILADAGTTVNVGAQPQPTAARLPTADEFTVAGFNLERFFDTSNDPAISEPVLTPTAFANRLKKASRAILDYLHAPDVIAVIEVENLATLQALANKVNSDAAIVARAPAYTAHLQEGNDVGGIDVGFLVKTEDIGGGINRVEVVDVTQFGKAATWMDPSDNVQHLLNDRPPLLLRAIVHYADGRAFPVSVLAVHQRSLNGVDSAASDGLTTEGDRVRRKRLAQAEYLANLLQQRQAADPQEHLVVLGDFNAFEFNDGYVDAMGTAAGTPAPDDQTAVAGDGIDLVNPDLINLAPLEEAGQRYSFVFGGNAQSLDHVLVNEALATAIGNLGFDHARINADFPETNRNDASSPSRLSDHDPLIAYFSSGSADLAITGIASSPGPYYSGMAVGYDVTVANNGTSAADYPGVGFVFGAELPLAIQAPPGWNCTTPETASGTTQATCNSTAPLANGAVAVFHLGTTLPPGLGGGYLTLDTAVSAQTYDPLPANNSASSTGLVTASADLSVALSGPTLMQIGREGSVVARVTNAGPDATQLEDLRFHVNVPGANVHVANAACTQYADGTAGAYPHSNAGTYLLCGPATLQPGGYVEYDLRVRPPVGVQFRRTIEIQADAIGTDADPQPANDSAATQIRVIWRAVD